MSLVGCIINLIDCITYKEIKSQTVPSPFFVSHISLILEQAVEFESNNSKLILFHIVWVKKGYRPSTTMSVSLENVLSHGFLS